MTALCCHRCLPFSIFHCDLRLCIPWRCVFDPFTFFQCSQHSANASAGASPRGSINNFDQEAHLWRHSIPASACRSQRSISASNFVRHDDAFFDPFTLVHSSWRSATASTGAYRTRSVTVFDWEAHCHRCSFADSACVYQPSLVASACVLHDDEFYRKRKFCFFICLGESLLKFYYKKYYHFIELYQRVPLYKELLFITVLLPGTSQDTPFDIIPWYIGKTILIF